MTVYNWRGAINSAVVLKRNIEGKGLDGMDKSTDGKENDFRWEAKEYIGAKKLVTVTLIHRTKHD